MREQMNLSTSSDFRGNKVGAPKSFRSTSRRSPRAHDVSRRIVQKLFPPAESLSNFCKSGIETSFFFKGSTIRKLFGTKNMMFAVNNGSLQPGHDLDIVRYDSDEHTRLSFPNIPNPIPGKKFLRNAMGQGWSVRFLHPQSYSARMRRLLRSMEDVLGCYCGANTYYTPAGAQGFAPHFDDVDVFIIQTEGRKKWSVYSYDGTRPRYPSEDFFEDDIGPPDFQYELEVGDILYLPRGTIHYAQSFPDIHSLHVTLSANQRNTYIDYLHSLFHMAVEKIAENNSNARRTISYEIPFAFGTAFDPTTRLPRKIYDGNELCHDCDETGFSACIANFVEDVFDVLSASLPGSIEDTANEAQTNAIKCKRREFAPLVMKKDVLSLAMDQYMKSNLTHTHPILRLKEQNVNTYMYEDSNFRRPEKVIRLLARQSVRVCLEAGECRMYYVSPIENVPETEGNRKRTHCPRTVRRGSSHEPVGMLRFEITFANALSQILCAYPDPMPIDELSFDTRHFSKNDVRDNRALLCKSLVETGLFLVL